MFTHNMVIDVHVFFDPKAIHSFVSLLFATQAGKLSSFMNKTLVVAAPLGRRILEWICVLFL